QLTLLSFLVEHRIERKVPPHLDDMDREDFCLRWLRERRRDTDDIWVDAGAGEGDDDAPQLHEAESLWAIGVLTAAMAGVAEVIRHVDDDGVRSEEQRHLEPQRGLAVEDPFPPVARDEFGEHDRDRSIVALVDALDVTQERRDQ